MTVQPIIYGHALVILRDDFEVSFLELDVCHAEMNDVVDGESYQAHNAYRFHEPKLPTDESHGA